MDILAKQGQNMMDLAIVNIGNFDGVVALAFQNGQSITAKLPNGSKLQTDDVFGNKIVNTYSNMAHQPATDVSRREERELCDAVGSNTADFGTFTFQFDDSFYK